MNLKKIISTGLIMMMLSLTGCSGNEKADETSSTKEAESSDENSEEASAFSEDEVVDLTTLSSTMVYSEVYNMMQNPKDYLGRKVKAKGIYRSMELGDAGNRYFFVLVSDAAACCEQGIEFFCENAAYPENYPEEEQEVTVTGVYELYEEDGETYYRLTVESVEDIVL